MALSLVGSASWGGQPVGGGGGPTQQWWHIHDSIRPIRLAVALGLKGDTRAIDVIHTKGPEPNILYSLRKPPRRFPQFWFLSSIFSPELFSSRSLVLGWTRPRCRSHLCPVQQSWWGSHLTTDIATWITLLPLHSQQNGHAGNHTSPSTTMFPTAASHKDLTYNKHLCRTGLPLNKLLRRVVCLAALLWLSTLAFHWWNAFCNLQKEKFQTSQKTHRKAVCIKMWLSSCW